VNKAILVTGATGFIGRALVHRLRESGREVLALGSSDGDIRQRSTFERFQGASVTAVIHLAGRSFVPDSWADPAGFMETNVLGTTNALEFCRIKGAQLVYVSAYVYGVPQRLPIDEQAPAQPNNPYALSKHLAEQTCQFYAEHLSVPVTVLRPFNVYGPGQDARFLIPSIVRQALEGDEIRVRDLAPKRDFVYVDDVVDAVLKAEGRKSDWAIFNIASGTCASVGDIIQVLQSTLGTSKAVVVEGLGRRNEIPIVIGDASRARAELGWVPEVSLSQGIGRIVGR
jgi:nucleoside-diphosphate-sugar epimerase